MRKRLIFGAAMAVSLAIVIAVAAVVPALGNSTSAATIQIANVVTHGTSGHAIIQLPQGGPSHPTYLDISVSDIDNSSDFGVQMC